MSAILFGSMGTVVDTSELQREAFNQAFADHGLDWSWDRDTYVAKLEQSGGRQRIEEHARSTGETVDAEAVHATKSQRFQEAMSRGGLEPRPGVAETIRAAKDGGLKVALVTTTSADNLEAMFAGLQDKVLASDFDLVVDTTQVETPKPDAAAYSYALQELEERPDDCVAVEDNVGGVSAAVAAGVPCLALPNQNTAGHDFGRADDVVESVDLDRLRELMRAQPPVQP